MNGKEALAFSRERKSLPNGDIDRGKNQEAVIEAIIRKITTKEIIYNYSTILKETKNTFQTNLTDKDITKIIKKELENIGGWNITSNVITGQGKLDYTYSYPTQKLYVMEINNNSLNNAINLIKKVINGDKLDGSYESPSNIKNPSQVIIEEPKEETKEEDNNYKEEANEEKENNEEKNPLDEILPDDKENKEDNKNNEEQEDTLKDILPKDEEANNS